MSKQEDLRKITSKKIREETRQTLAEIEWTVFTTKPDAERLQKLVFMLISIIRNDMEAMDRIEELVANMRP